MWSSSIYRLMFAVVTAAVGVTAMRTQSDFWYGAFVTLVAGWAVEAFGRVLAPRKRGERASGSAFVLALGACLFYGFGPWSDVRTRRSVPDTSKEFQAWIPGLRRPTFAFFRLMVRTKPQRRAVILSYGREGRLKARIDYTVAWERPIDVDDLFMSIKAGINGRNDVMYSATLGPGYVMTEDSIEVFMNACYVLASWCIACVTAAAVALVWRGTQRRGVTTEHTEITETKRERRETGFYRRDRGERGEERERRERPES